MIINVYIFLKYFKFFKINVDPDTAGTIYHIIDKFVDNCINFSITISIN